jgi:hypothetical protein
LRCNLAKQHADSNILRGHALTSEEIIDNPDIESGLETTDHFMQLTDGSLNRRNVSQLSTDSVLELTSRWGDEIPEEDNCVSDVDIHYLPVVKCDVDWEESEDTKMTTSGRK